MNQRSKKILMVIDLLNPGGAQRQFVGLAKLLKDEGFTVRIIYYEDYRFFKHFLYENGVENILVTSSKNKILHYPSIYKQIKCHIAEFHPDAVISYLRIPSILCSLAHRKDKSFKLIVSERNTTQVLDWMEKLKFRSFKWADAIVPNSYSQERFIQEHYPHYMPITHTITNFVDTDFFCPLPQDEKPVHDVPEILCVGRIASQKNVTTFLKALNIVKDKGYRFQVYWYGKTFGAYSEACKQQVKDEGLTDCFEFCGDSNKIRDIYQRADIFCLPSLYEGFPNVICEAMSCGIPVLASDVCDNPDIVTPSCGILFNPLDVNNMADCIIQMISLPLEERTDMGKAARERSLSLFASDVFIKKYKDLLI